MNVNCEAIIGQLSITICSLKRSRTGSHDINVIVKHGHNLLLPKGIFLFVKRTNKNMSRSMVKPVSLCGQGSKLPRKVYHLLLTY